MNYYGPEDFYSVDKYDMHVHYNTHQHQLLEQAKKDNFRLFSINTNVVPDFEPVAKQQEYATHALQSYPERFDYSTAFTLDNWHSKDWQQQTLDYLKESFNKGAVGVKVWKNIGMELRDKDGSFVMIDDSRFDPILDFIEKNDITLLGHLGEPRNCWLPLEEMAIKNDYDYFSKHPQYHMYLHPEYPSYQEQIDARDRMLDKHPNIRFVGLHLASLEWSVDEVAKRLDKYPNMSVDTAERISHLQYQATTDHQKVYDFFIKYQDRIIYGTDIILDDTQSQDEAVKKAHALWTYHWKFFTADEMMEAPELKEPFRALHLPREVADKLYYKNYRKWYPNTKTK